MANAIIILVFFPMIPGMLKPRSSKISSGSVFVSTEPQHLQCSLNTPPGKGFQSVFGQISPDKVNVIN